MLHNFSITHYSTTLKSQTALALTITPIYTILLKLLLHYKERFIIGEVALVKFRKFVTEAKFYLYLLK